MQGVGEVIIAKHRNGSLDTARLKFIGKFTKFCDLDVGNQYGGFPTGGDFEGQFNQETNTITFQSKANKQGDSGSDTPPVGSAPF